MLHLCGWLERHIQLLLVPLGLLIRCQSLRIHLISLIYSSRTHCVIYLFFIILFLLLFFHHFVLFFLFFIGLVIFVAVDLLLVTVVFFVLEVIVVTLLRVIISSATVILVVLLTRFANGRPICLDLLLMLLLHVHDVLINLLNLRVVQLHLHAIVQVVHHLLLGVVEVLLGGSLLVMLRMLLLLLLDWLLVLCAVDLLKVAVVFIEIGVEKLCGRHILILESRVTIFLFMLSPSLTAFTSLGRGFIASLFVWLLIERCRINDPFGTFSAAGFLGVLIVATLGDLLIILDRIAALNNISVFLVILGKVDLSHLLGDHLVHK